MAGAALVLLGLTFAHTWPLVTAPGTLSRNDNGDCQLNEWIVSWVAHQLPRDPLRLYDANIFHPEPRTLAFSEPLLVPAILGAPVRWLGGSPVLTYNLLLLAGLWSTALAGFVAGWRFTGDAAAALLSASLLAFNPQTLTRLPHLQAQWAALFPIALLLLDRMLGGTPRARDPLWLGLSVALLALTSGYWGALVVVALLAALLARSDEAWRKGRAFAKRLLLAAAVALALGVPLLFPYWRAHREQGLTRSLDEAAAFASAPASYLATPARVHYETWSHRFFGARGGAFFPGLVALLLAAYACAQEGLRCARVRALIAIAAAGFVLSLGPATPFYAVLRALFPPMRGLRDPSRFGYLLLLAVGLLAAIGLRALRKRLPGRGGALLAFVLVAAANAEARVAPFDFVRFEGLSPVYRSVADSPAGSVLAEFPLYPPAEIYRNAEYVLASTAHWKPLVNGYSGFTPPAYVQRAEALRGFPDEASFVELRRLGVSHLVVHVARYREPRRGALLESLEARGDLELLETGPSGERLYRVRSAS